MTKQIWLASPIQDFHLVHIERNPSVVVANYLPNSRPPKARDYVVIHRTVSDIILPDGSWKRHSSDRYLLMTYAFFRKNYKWSPAPGQTPFQTQVCEPTYL